MKATYHAPNGPLILDVIAKHDNGTLDLGRGKDILVRSCLVTEDPVVGSCVLVADPKAAAAEKGK